MDVGISPLNIVPKRPVLAWSTIPKLKKFSMKKQPRRRLGLALQRGLEPAEGLVPLAFDVVEPPSRLVEAGRLDLPDVVAAHAGAAHQAGAREHVQVLRDGLARDARTRGEAGDRHRSPRAQSGDEAEAGLVPERGEDRRGAGELAVAETQPSSASRHTSRSPASGTSSPPRAFDRPGPGGPEGPDRTRTLPR